VYGHLNKTASVENHQKFEYTFLVTIVIFVQGEYLSSTMTTLDTFSVHVTMHWYHILIKSKQINLGKLAVS